MLSLYSMWATYKNTFYEVRKSLLDLVLLNPCGPGTMWCDDTASQIKYTQLILFFQAEATMGLALLSKSWFQELKILWK